MASRMIRIGDAVEVKIISDTNPFVAIEKGKYIFWESGLVFQIWADRNNPNDEKTVSFNVALTDGNDAKVAFIDITDTWRYRV